MILRNTIVTSAVYADHPWVTYTFQMKHILIMTLAKLPHPCSRPSPASMQAKAQNFRVCRTRMYKCRERRMRRNGLLTPLTYVHVGEAT